MSNTVPVGQPARELTDADVTGVEQSLSTIERVAQSPSNERSMLMRVLEEAQVDFLLQRTPKHEIKHRQGRGGMQFAYTEHQYTTERLNLIFGFDWDFVITDRFIFEDVGKHGEVGVEARLTVRTPKGQTIVKTQFGQSDIKVDAQGNKLSIIDDYKAAGSDALKKCASLLGIGLDVYGRDTYGEMSDGREQGQGQSSSEAHQARQPSKSGTTQGKAQTRSTASPGELPTSSGDNPRHVKNNPIKVRITKELREMGVPNAEIKGMVDECVARLYPGVGWTFDDLSADNMARVYMTLIKEETERQEKSASFKQPASGDDSAA